MLLPVSPSLLPPHPGHWTAGAQHHSEDEEETNEAGLEELHINTAQVQEVRLIQFCPGSDDMLYSDICSAWDGS